MIDETTKYAEKQRLDRVDSLRETDKPKPPKKEGKSTFDEMLEQGKFLQQSSIDHKSSTKTSTQQAIQELEKRQERSREQSKDREKEDESKQQTKEERTESGLLGRKIVGKTGLKKQQDGGHGGSFEQGGFSSKREYRSSAHRKLNLDATGFSTNQTQLGKAFQTYLKKQANFIPKQLSQELLNQLVRYVRIGLNKEGNKEIELDLHKEVFKGLRLRLTANRGKVSVHFLTANLEVRELFERETSKIEGALVAKGIAVQEIKVS